MFVIQQIIIDGSGWLVMLCILAGLLYAFALYYRENRYEFSPRRRLWMGTIRALSVALISFFLLSPFFRSTTRNTEDPVIIFAQDQSASLIATKDSLFYKKEYPALVNSLIAALEENYQVHTFSFGERFRENIDFTYSDKQTNLSEVLIEARSRYLNRNVGALIIASDGIYNHGIHPQYALQYLPFPVYTIALGDTTQVRDAAIVNVIHNRIAYLDNIFPIEIHVRGLLCNGLSTSLRVLQDGRLLHSEQIKFSGDTDNHFIPVELLAQKPGLQRYRVEILPVDGEIHTGNNSRDIFIEVLEARPKVLILYSSPHPDVSAIRQTLEAQQNYEVEVLEASAFRSSFNDFNLVILHQVPSKQQAYPTLLRNLNESGLPVLHILGSNSDLNVFNTLGIGLSITGSGNRLDEALAVVDQGFALFTLSDEFHEALRFFPPLFSPFGNYRESLASNVLFHKRIGSLVTDSPLMTFTEISGRKAAIIAGEGVWRWRLANFSRRGNHEAFNEWLTKSVQFLALREQKERFLVKTQNIWNENEVIGFTAEFYNESYEAVNSPEVELIITDEDSNQYPFVFSRTGNSYSLRPGSLQAGNYTYQASLPWQNETFRAGGAFSVLPLQVELTNTVADHRLLYGLADAFGGETFMPGEMDEIVEILRKRDDLKPVYYLEKNYFELIEVRWLLFLMLLFLAIEWLFRRVSGGY